MPGGYAHITSVNMMRERIDGLTNLSSEVKAAFLREHPFCELGSVSPDYPYLAVGDGNAAKWADTMHHEQAGAFIRAGVEHILSITGAERRTARRKCTAWLLGYAAHMTADVTIHPIVNLKVGRYEQNKTAHRVCEMHQDVYIYQRLNTGALGKADHLKSSLKGCSRNPADPRALDMDITAIWTAILNRVHAAEYQANKPDFDLWHRRFCAIVDTIDDSNRLPALARHVAVNAGAVYPLIGEIEHDNYINSLETPEGQMHYDAIFERALDNVETVWGWIGEDLEAGQIAATNQIGIWSFDDGAEGGDNETTQKGQMVFWNGVPRYANE